jgi:hypothetical protein
MFTVNKLAIDTNKNPSPVNLLIGYTRSIKAMETDIKSLYFFALSVSSGERIFTEILFISLVGKKLPLTVCGFALCWT